MTVPDIASLIAATAVQSSTGLRQQAELGFHQGTVLAWNSVSHSSVIDVAGSLIRDMGVLATSDALLLHVGDTVGILRFRSTYFLLGRIAQAGVSRLDMQFGGPLGFESTTSTTFTDLATPGPSVNVTISSARRALVWISSEVQCAQNGGLFGFEIKGPINQDPGNDGAFFNLNASNVQGTVTIPILLKSELILAGDYIFTMKYRANSNTSAVFFNNRRIIVFPY